MGRLKIILLAIAFFCFNLGYSQSLKNSITGNDIWGAWLVKGTSKVWLVDSIPERARLWDYSTNEVIASFDLQSNVKDINLLDDGSIAYIMHDKKYAYVVLGADGTQKTRKFNYLASSYYIHPSGKYFLGSLNEGFVTYTINGDKISKSKLNKNIVGHSNGFLRTNFESTVFRFRGDSIQKIDVAANGSLTSSTVIEDKYSKFLNLNKDELLLVSPKATQVYSLPDLELKNNFSEGVLKGFLSGTYDSDEKLLYCSKDSKIATFDLNDGKWISSVDLNTGDVYFEDRDGSSVVCFSDEKSKFYIIDLQTSGL